MRPRSSRPSSLRFSSALACVAALGCGAQHLRTLDAPPEADGGGVAPVDPQSTLPRPLDVAREGDVVATLRAPLPSEAIAEVVRRLFEAFHARSTASVEDDLDDTILDLRIDSSGAVGDRPKGYFLSDLAQRMKASSFDQLDVEQMYRSQEVEVYAREELGQPGRPPRPPSMAADDVLVRVPIATPRVGADALFGDEIKLLLRRAGRGYKIHGYGELVPR